MKKIILNFLALAVLSLYTICPSYAVSKFETVSNKVLTPIGYAIGAVAAPAVITIDYSKKTVDWTNENIVSPVLEAVMYTVEWTWTGTTDTIAFVWSNTVVPAIDVIAWTGDNILMPIAETTAKASSFALKYTAVPVAKGMEKAAEKVIFPVIGKTFEGIFFVVEKTYDGISFGTEYIIVPTTKSIIKGAKYLAVPVGKGILYGGKYTVVPIGKGLAYSAQTIIYSLCWTADKIIDGVEFGAKYTVIPVANGIDWSYDNVIYPAASSIGSGITKTVSPIYNAINTVVDKINFF